MKKRFLVFLPIFTLLASCGGDPGGGGGGGEPVPGRDYGDDKTYALFMYNIPRETSESPNGMEEKVENTLFAKYEITVGELITPPGILPQRKNYEFACWCKDKEGYEPWVFETEVAKGSTILYAKWTVTHEDDYEEPEYIPPERIIEDMDYRVTGILNKELKEGMEVDLTTAGINRLKKHADDCRFAVNYEHKVGVELTSATFNDVTKVIHLVFPSGELDIHVNDITESLNIKKLFPSQAYIDGYETKAKNYESREFELDENYHIALMGSSSMENWDTSTEDMAPIKTFNHGIGGTTVENWTDALLERLVVPYSPKAVVYYVGVNNIINQNDNGTVCGNKLNALFDKTHAMLPDAKIFYILINKLPYYPHCQDDFDIANQMARDYESAHEYLTCIDAGQDLLKENGLPHWAYFRTDGLHMSRYGYVLWGARVKKAIIDWLG